MSISVFPQSLHWLGDSLEAKGFVHDKRGCVLYFESESDCQEFMTQLSEAQDSAAEAAHERHQQSLMENGPGPTLLEQQQAALKLK